MCPHPCIHLLSLASEQSTPCVNPIHHFHFPFDTKPCKPMPTHLIIIKCHAAFLTALHQAIVFSHPHCHFHFLCTNDNIKQVPKLPSCHAIFLAAMLPPSSSSCSSSAQHCEVPRPTFTFFSLFLSTENPHRDRGRRYSGEIINNQYI